MKLSLASLLALALFQGIVAAPAEPLEKRSVVATVYADALKYRTCPRTSCTAVGQYGRGDKLTLTCFTNTDTTTVGGNPAWGRISNGYYVAIYYLDWSGGSLPKC